jgi:hypothetical protein
MYKRLLVALDGTPEPQVGLSAARTLAKRSTRTPF